MARRMEAFAGNLGEIVANGEERMPDCPDQVTRLFVYGTLMPGHCNHHRIERFVHRARLGRIPGILVDLGAFPALVPGDGIVEGVVLDIDTVALAITIASKAAPSPPRTVACT